MFTYTPANTQIFCPRVHPSLPEIKWTRSRRFKSQGTAGVAERPAQSSVMQRALLNTSRASHWKEPVVLKRDQAMWKNRKKKKKKGSLFGVCCPSNPSFCTVWEGERERCWIWRSSSTSHSLLPVHHGTVFTSTVRYKYAANGKPWALDSLRLGIPGLICVLHLNKACWWNLTNDVWVKLFWLLSLAVFQHSVLLPCTSI